MGWKGPLRPFSSNPPAIGRNISHISRHKMWCSGFLEREKIEIAAEKNTAQKVSGRCQYTEFEKNPLSKAEISIQWYLVLLSGLQGGESVSRASPRPVSKELLPRWSHPSLRGITYSNVVRAFLAITNTLLGGKIV